ncbi:hypothetical protein GJAV_G00193830 [Gymnothorax javanicus]|nr:hypothetical protein GJAV_G00193830 [Gymnothorax javanicus]
MQSIKRTAVVLAFILALSGVVSGAPIINWNACTEISARLNQLAQHFAREVLDGSRVSLFNISEQVVLVEPRDMCDPAGLKIDSEPCLQKIITALGNYSRIFQKRGLFVGSKKEMAQNVVATVSELLGQLRTVSVGWSGSRDRMNVGVAHSEVNPNTRVMNSRGIWLAYLLLVAVLHIVLLSIPFLSVPLVWTLTNVIHNLVMYLFLHTVKGTPFETPDQGKARLLTHWEQMDYGIQFTASRKFLTISPIVLYILASFYTKYDATHFLINTGSLLSVLLPKLPQFHGVRIFGINKY